MDNGWIKLHRSILDWEWFDDDNVFRLFIHLLLNVNHKEKKWMGQVIKKGERITSQKHLAEETGMTVRQVRTALNKLKSTGELTVKTTNKFSLIKVNNWDTFQQDDRQDVTRVTGKRQSNDNQMTTNKNDNNDKNEKNTSELSSQDSINEIFNIFYESINPTINYGNKTSRKAVDWMIKKWGVDAVKRIATYAWEVHGQPYAPTITTPYQLKEKISNLKAYKEKQENNSNKEITII